jgi:hypothetical protein
MKFGSLNLLEPQGSLQVCKGDFQFQLYNYFVTVILYIALIGLVIITLL